MEMEELGIKGAWLARSPVHEDDRGIFSEWFKSSDIESKTGRPFKVAQANMSMSNKGVIRGIHFNTSKIGQGKWVTCVAGSIWDVVVDIRPDSKTFKKWIGTELKHGRGEAIFISEGLGHSFISLEDNSVVTYLMTSQYSPEDEFGVHPLDPDLAIEWPIRDSRLSVNDASAPSLQKALESLKL